MKQGLSLDQYYSGVYTDLVKYGVLDVDDIKTDKDLQTQLQSDPKLSQKLIDQLKKTSEHQNVKQANRPTVEGQRYQLKNGKTVKLAGRRRVKNVDVLFYRDTVVFGKKSRKMYRNVSNGRFVKV